METADIKETKEEQIKTPSLEDFSKMMGDSSLGEIVGEKKSDEKPAEKPEEKKEETVKPEGQKPEEKPETKVESPVTPDNTQQQQPNLDNRNYEGFSEEEKGLLKKMSNAAFDWSAKTIRTLRTKEQEATKLQEKVTALEQNREVLPDSYYQNPESYKLTSEYRTLESHAVLSEQIFEHWKKQATAIEKGEDWYMLARDKDGNVVIGEKKPASAEAKTEVFDYMSRTYNQVLGYQNSLGNYQQAFAAKHSAMVSKLKEAEGRFFPGFDNDTFEGKELLEKSRKYIMDGGITKDNPTYELLAKSITLNLILKELLLRNKNVDKVKADEKAAALKAGPNGNNFSGGTGLKEDKKPAVTLDMYDKL